MGQTVINLCRSGALVPDRNNDQAGLDLMEYWRQSEHPLITSQGTHIQYLSSVPVPNSSQQTSPAFVPYKPLYKCRSSPLPKCFLLYQCRFGQQHTEAIKLIIGKGKSAVAANCFQTFFFSFTVRF